MEGITIRVKDGMIRARIHYLHPDGRYRSTFREFEVEGRRVEIHDLTGWLTTLQVEMENLKAGRHEEIKGL